jgi:hypothetical protein
VGQGEVAGIDAATDLDVAVAEVIDRRAKRMVVRLLDKAKHAGVFKAKRAGFFAALVEIAGVDAAAEAPKAPIRFY